MKRAWSYTLILLSVLGASPARSTAADALFALPPPTGPHAVGRVTVQWTDSSRGDAGHLDLRKVGALGHCSGGRAAAAACRDDRRFRACLNQDGLVMMQPYDRAA